MCMGSGESPLYKQYELITPNMLTQKWNNTSHTQTQKIKTLLLYVLQL